MKAFSFLSILKNFGKQLSSLASQMPWRNLRFNLGTISVLSRVNPLFSRASFGTSRRASHFAAILTILFTIGVGSVSAQEPVVFEGDNLKVTSEKSITVSDVTLSTSDMSNLIASGSGKTFTLKSENAISKVEITMSGTSNRYKASDITDENDNTCCTSCNRNDKVYTCLFSTPQKTINFKNSGGGVTITKLRITLSSGTPVTSVSLNKTSTTLEIGGTETLTATIEPNDATNKNVNWSSDATSVATVDENGLVTAVAAGTATITVTTADGNKTATCAVTVNAAQDPDPGTGGDGDCYSTLAYSGGAEMPGWTIVSTDSPTPQIKNNTIAMQSGSSYAYSSGLPTRGMYFDANQNATISITSYCTNSRAFCLVEKNGDNYSIIQTWDGEETLTAAIVSGRRYYLTSKAGSSDNAKCNIKVISFSDCSASSDTYDIHIGKNNANYTDESLTNTSGTTWSKTITLDAGSYYEFKVKKTPSAGDAVWYGNNGRIFGTTSPAWDFSTGTDNCKLYTSVAGSYTFSWDASNNKLTVTYPAGSHPTKRIYMACGDTWCKDSPRFFVHSWLDSNTADTELTVDACDGDVYTADIPWFHDYVIFTRQAPASTGIVWEGSNFWNRSNRDFYLNNYNKLTFTSWTDGKGNFSGGTYSPATYSITFNGNGNTGGSMTDVTGIACGGSTTLAANTFTRTGYTFAGWATTADGAVAHADKATISNITSDITLYAKWTVDSYTVTWKPAGGNWAGNTDNIVQTYEYGAKINAPEKPSRTGYEFVEWNPTYVVNETTMPANDVTYTATWTAKTTTITINANTANHGSTTPGNVTATYGSALPSFTAATGASGYSLIGYFTAATGGTKVINADGTLVASTDYADGSGKWKSEDATLTLFAQYEEEADACYEFTPATSGSAPSQGDVINGTGSGGTMVAGTGQSYTANGLKFESSGDYRYVTVTLDNNLKEGSVIAVTIWMDGTSSNRGLYLQTSAGTKKAEWKFTADSENHQYSYTVEAGDGLINTNVFRLARINNVYLKTVTVSNCGDAVCTTPTTAFANGEYTVGGSALDLSTLFTSNSNGAVTYTVTNANGTGATIASTSFTATSAGTATVTAIQAADGDYCEKVMDATITVNAAPITPDPSGEPIITNTLATGTVTWGSSISTTDETNITNLTALAATGLTIDGNGNTNNGGQTAKITGTETNKNVEKYMSLGFRVACGKKLVVSEIEIPVQPVTSNTNNFEAVLTDGTTTITGTINNVTNGELQNITFNSYGELVGNVTLKLYAWGWTQGYRLGQAVKIYGTIEEGATPAATITWNTQPVNGQVGSADFAYAVSCSDGSAVTVTSANDAVATIVGGKLHYAAAGTTHLVATATDACGNTITQNSNEFTVTAASDDPDPEPGDCEELFAGSATSTSEFTTPVGSATTALSSGNSFSAGGYSYSVKPNSSNAIVASPKDGGSFAVGDSLIVVVYNNQSGDKTMGFKLGSGTYTTSVGSKKLHIFRQVLVASDISAGKVTFNRQSSDDRWVEIIIKHCGLLPSCTTPVLSDLEDQKVCPGEDVSWTAIVNNTEDLQDGEIFAYQWNKKGNNTVLSSNATLTLNDVTEAAGGTYVVTATVSAEGKASKKASKEVTLTVTPATATPTITANANTIYTGNSVTLTATCASSGVGYQWYTCNADGTNAQAIGGATNATYTLTAGEAGTYYYKVIVTGDGTYSCGTAEKVYTLVVSASNSGETTCGEITGQFTSGAYTFDTDFIIYGINSGGNLDAGASSSSGNSRCGGSGSYFGKQRFVVTFPVDVLSFSFIGYQSNLRTVEAVKTTADLKTADTEYTNITHTAEASQEGDCQTHVITPETAIPANTFVWVELNNGLNISEICYVPVSTADCTDPQVTATIIDNATVCAGTENVTFTATNYADGTTFQWQKKNGNTWKNIDATSATYTIISPVTTEHAGQYRVIATKECSRTSEELTLTVLTAPEFNAFANTASVMKGNALTINDVEATNATDYTWYKSADNSFDVGADTKVGTTKELLLAASSITEEADQAFYLFCVASNSCGSVTSNAITVTVTPFVEEECATAGNEGEHEFGFENIDCSSDTYGDSKTPVWKTNSRNKYLTYTAPEGKYFATAKVTVAHTGGTKCGYAYSTNGGTTWVVAELDGLSATLNAITINFLENVNAFRISRNLTAQDGEKGSTSGNFYLAEACFTYENACTPTSVTPTTTSFEYNMSVQMDFVEPTFTVKHGEEVVNDAVLTYTSSNPAIATVDEDGSVTFEGMTGTVTITAAYAGTTIDEIEYCASEGSYTITVGCQDQEPKIIAAAGTNLDGCNNSITLEAKMQDGTTAFADGTFQWYRDGEAIEGATSASYEVVRAGTYTVSRTDACIKMSSNSAVVTNENPEPKVERLTPFQYYHVNKTYSNQMKDRHLFAVTSYGTLDGGKRYHLTATRNGQTLNLSSSTAFFTKPSSDNAVDTVMIDLNALTDKYDEGDEIVITCAPINNCNEVSAITSSITIHVIDQKPTLALICSGANGDGTRDTEKLVVGGDFLTGYNKADLCQQTGNKTFDPNTEWGFYEALQDSFIVTPVNGYAQFNKLNYEPFDILLLTDYPKSSKSEAAQKIIDDMAELCDYRPLLSFKTHFQSDKWKDKTTGEYKYTKWVKKGFTTAPVVPKQTATYVNIVCYAHPMFEDIDDINDQYTFHDHDDPNQLVYQVLTGPGYESSKGIQGFELADADNFVTIGLVHYNATANEVTHDGHTHISWNAEANDRLLVAMAERQTNIEARMILFSLNCGAQSLQTPGGRNVILQCLKYLLETDPLKVADCRMTFDNGAGNNDFDKNNYEGTGTKGDGLWSTAANWGPDYIVVPGRNNDVRIAAPCIVDANNVEVLSVHITENGSLIIPADKSLTARSTILRADENGNVYPTNVEDISLGSNAGGNASLILNNERGDTKAGVAMYSKAYTDEANTWNWQYVGTPHNDVNNALYNYYNSWLYSWNGSGWSEVPTGGAVEPWVGYCITHPEPGHTYWMEGTLAATTNQDITIPAGKYVVVANSWTAPIQINELTDDDMEGLTDKSIYFFNTGSDPEGDNSLTANATGEARWAPSTYISVPIHAADYTDKDANIPSMQGFYVVGGTTDGTLHLDYERHVRAPRTNTPSGPMHAPARIADTDNEPQVAKFLFRGTRYDDRLIILERPDFTRGYDSGWDGEQWGGNAAAPMSYVVAETRYDAVSAIPEYEGTVIGFRAGEDNIYTIHFDYDGMEEALYLLDTETKIYTRVLKGNSYTFACPDKAEHNRFILTRKAPQIATGTENIATGENAKAVKFIKDDKIFIFVNGILYDATGKMVIR